MFGSKLYAKQIDEDAFARLVRKASTLPDSYAGMVLSSFYRYAFEGEIEAPGMDKELGLDERVPKEAIEIFGQFLKSNGEDPEMVDAEMQDGLDEMTSRQMHQATSCISFFESIG